MFFFSAPFLGLKVKLPIIDLQLYLASDHNEAGLCRVFDGKGTRQIKSIFFSIRKEKDTLFKYFFHYFLLPSLNKAGFFWDVG